jgi:hypothetical protein
VLPSLLSGTGSWVAALSPGPLGLSRYVDEHIAGSRDPAEAAAHLRALLVQRTFDWVIVADERLLRALVESAGYGKPSRWLPFDPLDEDAAGLLLSKYAFAQRAPALGIKTPESHLAATTAACVAAARSFGYPVVLKGDQGFAGLEVAVVADEERLRLLSAGLIARYGRVLVQRFIKGRQASVVVLYDRGVPLGFKPYLAECSFPTADSPSTLHEHFRHPSLENVVRAVGATTGFHGFAGIDFMFEAGTGELYALEVNPRPTIAVGGNATNRAFFTPLVEQFMRGERRPLVAFEPREGVQPYFPVHLFYFLHRADKLDPRSYRRALSCLRSFDPVEWRLAAWEGARFAYDQLTKCAPSIRTSIDAARGMNPSSETRRATIMSKETMQPAANAAAARVPEALPARSETGSDPKVCVAIATYRRPHLLAALLRKLPDLTFRAGAPQIEVLVVDNDPEGGARPIVEQAMATMPWTVHYRNVATPGLCVVRNYAIEFAAREFDLLAMIDDDEEPAPNWLDELLRVQLQGAADAVIGPVPRTLPEAAPRWIRRGDFFPAAAFDVADGHRVKDGHTGNCLLKLDTITSLGLAFDSAMNLTGGEDVLFFRQLVAGGGCIRFAANAVATETVPLARTKARYILLVEFRSGNTLSYCDRLLGTSARASFVRLVKGLGLIGVGLVTLPARVAARQKAGAVKSACNIARGAGMLSGLVGYRVAMYKRPAPRDAGNGTAAALVEAGAALRDGT